jgi:hypothetical protein
VATSIEPVVQDLRVQRLLPDLKNLSWAHILNQSETRCQFDQLRIMPMAFKILVRVVILSRNLEISETLVLITRTLLLAP